MKVEFKRGKKKFEIYAQKRDISSTGLMFTRRKNAKALIFDMKKQSKLSLTSLFVFFSFIAIWLDEKNNVIQLKVCKPWRFLIKSEKEFYKILEIPINRRYKKIISELI